MTEPLLRLSPERRAKEVERATQEEAAVRAEQRAARRMLQQCVALGFAGVPLYAWAWNLADQRQARVVAAAAFLVSYAFPFFRWLHFQISRSEAFE